MNLVKQLEDQKRDLVKSYNTYAGSQEQTRKLQKLELKQWEVNSCYWTRVKDEMKLESKLPKEIAGRLEFEIKSFFHFRERTTLNLMFLHHRRRTRFLQYFAFQRYKTQVYKMVLADAAKKDIVGIGARHSPPRNRAKSGDSVTEVDFAQQHQD